MATQDISTHTFPNGLTLVAESMAEVQSAAFSILVPGGSIYDPPAANGTAAVLCDLMTRGAGDYNSRQLAEALDNLGVQHQESVGNVFLSYSGAMVADNLVPALRLYADILRRPHLPPEHFDAVKTGLEQSLRAVEDEPRQKIMREVRRRCYPPPWNRPTDGTLETLPQVTLETVRQLYECCFRPNGAIIGVAGKIDVAQLQDALAEFFGDWTEKPEPEPTSVPGETRGDHLEHDSTQTHIGLAFPSVPYRDADYYKAWAAVSVLSGGMSSRLFTEVREKRGLCYAISASLHTLRDAARVMGYAGTTNERAQHTLDAMLLSILWLSAGIAAEELERCKARAKSSLIMQQESTMARSSSIARDWYHLGRVTTLDEVHEKIDALTVDSVLDFVHRHPPRDFTIVTIGPKPLERPFRVSAAQEQEKEENAVATASEPTGPETG